jgi:hypothetical protein
MTKIVTKRRLAWIALAIIGALAAFAALWSAFGPDQIVLTTAQLQERINRALPREFKGITVEQATINVADGRVTLRVTTNATALGQTVKAVVSARGVPRYDGERGEIFFDAEDVKVTDVALAGGSLAEHIGRLGALRERAEMAAGSAAAAGLKAYLAAQPVYRFKGDIRGIVLRATLADVAMQTDSIVIKLAVVKLTATVAVCLAVLLAVAFLIVQLVRHPDWGLVILDIALDAIPPPGG